jgi:Family of unknown function (DUF6401)
MVEAPAQLSATALRLAGHVGQTALDRIGEGGVAAAAELDQHMAAVRAELGAWKGPWAAQEQVADRNASRSTARHAPARRAGRGLGGVNVTCPDVPFVSTALQAEETVPIKLLLHYACGFVEAAVRDDWWPEESADATDWSSMRLAAVCQLILHAEAAAELHPDLRAIA